MKDNNIYISTNLQYLRKEKNKTQKDIGDICGKTDTAISNWEKGIREPDATDLGILANYFNTTVDDIMFKDLRFNNEKENSKSFDKADILFNKIKDLPPEKQQIILNVTENLINEIDKELEGQ